MLQREGVHVGSRDGGSISDEGGTIVVVGRFGHKVFPVNFGQGLVDQFRFQVPLFSQTVEQLSITLAKPAYHLKILH